MDAVIPEIQLPQHAKVNIKIDVSVETGEILVGQMIPIEVIEAGAESLLKSALL